MKNEIEVSNSPNANVANGNMYINVLDSSIKLEEERKQKEEWLNKKTFMELELKQCLSRAKVWKRSSPDGYRTIIQEKGAAIDANKYNELLICYINFCKSFNEEPSDGLKYIADIHNKGADFEYGLEPKFFDVYPDNN